MGKLASVRTDWPFKLFPLYNTPEMQELHVSVVPGAGSIVYNFYAEGYIFLVLNLFYLFFAFLIYVQFFDYC